MEGATADGGRVNGMLNMRLQIQRDDVPKLVNIFANSGRELNRGFFVKMYETEIMSRVVIPLLSKQADINAVRSPDFADMIEMAVRAEMRGSFDQYGNEQISDSNKKHRSDEPRKHRSALLRLRLLLFRHEHGLQGTLDVRLQGLQLSCRSFSRVLWCSAPSPGRPGSAL